MLWTPGKDLVSILVHDPQGIWLLRHVQGLEERLGSDLGILQIERVMFNLAQSGMGLVRVPDPKELDGEHRRSSALLEEPIGLPNRRSLGNDLMFYLDRSIDAVG